MAQDIVREDRYHDAIVNARPEEQALSWYHHLERKISFPFRAMCRRQLRLTAWEG